MGDQTLPFGVSGLKELPEQPAFLSVEGVIQIDKKI